VTDRQRSNGGGAPPPEIDIDLSVAHPARVHNYLAGGDAHFTVDREAVDQAAAVLPGGLETARRAVRSMAEFHARVVRYLVVEAGITQFLKLGAVVPAVQDVHEIAQAAAPGARVVYVGSDPTVLAHAHSLRQAGPEGITAYLHGTVYDVEAIVEQASATLDWGQPIALLLPATLNFVPEERDPHGTVARLVDALPSGSYMVLTHTSHETGSERMLDAAERFGKVLGKTYVVRTRDDIIRFFAGLDLVEPGLVQIDQWNPPPPPPVTVAASDHRPVPIYGGAGRKR
jgi:hypothetical protein